MAKGRTKSRHKKFRGRTYLKDLDDYLGDDGWERVKQVVKQFTGNLEQYMRVMYKLDDVEVHRVDISSNSAGHASWKWRRLDLHAALFRDTQQMREELDDTLWHEIAHFVAAWACDEWGHGKKWKEVFKAFGFEPRRCHSLGRLPGITGKPRTRTRYVYECTGCGKRITRGRQMKNPELWGHKNCDLEEDGWRLLRKYREVID